MNKSKAIEAYCKILNKDNFGDMPKWTPSMIRHSPLLVFAALQIQNIGMDC